MKHDPRTQEGKEEINKILQRRKHEADEARKRSEMDIEDEPTGKLTKPNELDIRRDRKDD